MTRRPQRYERPRPSRVVYWLTCWDELLQVWVDAATGRNLYRKIAGAERYGDPED